MRKTASRAAAEPPALPGTTALIDAALAEDVGRGDVTTASTIAPGARGRASLVAREACVVCGIPLVERVVDRLLAAGDGRTAVQVERRVEEGASVGAGTVLAEIEGALSAILTAERVILNLIQHLSGIATETRRYVEAVAGTGAAILDTRKTLPGLRLLQKYAVRVGGGRNHRFGLDDGVLIKDNHVAACGSVRAAVERARAGAPHGLRIEVECDRIEQVREAIDAGAEVILLDNMNAASVRSACRLVAGRARVEVSGGVSLATVRGLAEAGANLISVGSLTHSVRAIDIGLDFPPVERRRGGGPRARR